MGGPADGLKRLIEFANPSVMNRIREAGAVNAKSPLALVRTLPWLIGRGPSLGIVSQMNAISIGSKVALHDRHGPETFAELDRRANQATHLLQECGVAPGDRIAMVMRNGREMIEIALAGQKLGVVSCPLNTWAKTKELEVTLASSEAKILFYDTAHASQVAKNTGGGMQLVHVGDPSSALPGSSAFEDLMAGQPTSAPPPFTRDRGAAYIVIHTSGTTGTPKGAKRDSSVAGLGPLADLLTVVPYRRDDTVFCPAPLFHSFGLATFTFASALGATLVLPEKFDPEESLRLIEEHQATAASFVPVMIRRILALPDKVKTRYDLSSLRIVLASGSAMSSDLRRAATALFGEVLYDLYGSTEVGWVAIASPEDMRARPSAVGKPTRGIEVALFDDDGNEVPIGETGEIFVKSDIIFEGYTSGEEKRSIDDYLSIGDLGRLDEEGYLFIEGRSDDMVVVGGENIYPIEVEQIIEALDGVSEAKVVGIHDEEYGQVLAAFVEGAVDEQQVIAICKEELASFKVPRRVMILDELPRTSTGKVLKRELLALIDH